jgi:chemotaxis protein CheX
LGGVGPQFLLNRFRVGENKVQELTGILEEITTHLDHLDQTVEEVFNTMMGISCAVMSEASVVNHNIVAIVGLAGVLRGACMVKVADATALRIASALMGTPAAQVDDLVTDSIGELCNMLAGGWKGRFPQLSSACALSVPMVTTGKQYTLRIRETAASIERSYLFESHCMTISIQCEA